MKEIKDDTNKCRDILRSWLGESIFWKWLYYPKQSTDSVQFTQNYLFFLNRTRINKFTICMETQKTVNRNS